MSADELARRCFAEAEACQRQRRFPGTERYLEQVDHHAEVLRDIGAGILRHLADASPGTVAAIRPGPRQVGRRSVVVERRSRRRASPRD